MQSTQPTTAKQPMRARQCAISGGLVVAPRVAGLVATLVLLIATSASAHLPKRPLRWANAGFARHSQAVEHVTLRGADERGNRTFIRFSMANAGYKKGRLTITVLQGVGAKRVYGKQTFNPGSYAVFEDRFGLQAGGNVLEVKGGKLHMRFQLGELTGTATLTPRGSGLTLNDRGPSGWIRRDLLTPWAKLSVDLRDSKGLTAKLDSTVFAVHEASTIKAHRTYDRVVQLHQVRGSRLTVVDYLVGPEERQRRPLGFVIVRGGGQRFVGRVTREERTAERNDRGNGYKVPWHIAVHAEHRGKVADVQLTTGRQVARQDDLAKLGFFARKAVGLLIHPYTYTLAGTWKAAITSATAAPGTHAVRVAGGQPPPAPASAASGPAGAQVAAASAVITTEGKAHYKYAQAR